MKNEQIFNKSFSILTFKIDLKFQISNLKFIKYLYFIF